MCMTSSNRFIAKFHLNSQFKLHYLDFDGDKVKMRRNDHFENALKYWDKNGLYLLTLFVTESDGEISEEEWEPVAEEDAEINGVWQRNLEKSNSKNNKVFTSNYDEERMSDGHIFDYFGSEKEAVTGMPSKSTAAVNMDVLKPASIKILSRIAKDAQPKESSVKGWFKDLVGLGAGENTKEGLNMMVVENDNIFDLGNDDIVVAVPGSVVKKTWRIANKLGNINL